MGKRGRPLTYTHVVKVRTTEEQYEFLVRMAAVMKTDPSVVLRSFLEHDLAASRERVALKRALADAKYAVQELTTTDGGK